MKNKTKKGLQRILSLFLTLATIITTVLTGVTFNPVVAEAKGAMPWLNGLNADVQYGATSNPEEKPTGANWGHSFNENLMKAAISRVGSKYSASEKSWTNETFAYDCSCFVFWSIIQSDGSGGFVNGSNMYSGDLPHYAAITSSDSFSYFLKKGYWVTADKAKHYLTRNGSNVPVLKCHDVASFKKAINDPAWYGWFITLDTETSYQTCIDNDLLKDGVIVSGGTGGNHTALSIGKVSGLSYDSKWLASKTGSSSQYYRPVGRALMGQKAYAAFVAKYPQATYFPGKTLVQWDYERDAWTGHINNSKTDGTNGKSTWRGWGLDLSSVSLQNSKGFYQGTNGTYGGNPTSSNWGYFRLADIANPYFKIEAGSEQSGVSINNEGWLNSSGAEAGSFSNKVFLGYFNDISVYGQFGVMKIDGVTGLGVDGIKFNAYSDVALKTLLGSQTSANGGYARFVVSDLDTKPWYTYDTLTKTFYVQEDKASAEGKGYEWNSTIYKVVVTGAANANNCTVEFTNAATGAKLSGADIGERVVGSTKYAYFVQRNQPKKLGGEMGVTKYYTDVLGNEIPLNGVVFGVYSDAACTKEITTITTNNGYAIITTDTLDNKAAWYATGAITKTYYFKEKDVSKATRASDGIAVQLRMSTDVVMAVVTGVEIEKISTEGKNKVVYTIGDKEVDSMYLDNGRVKAFKMENFPKGLMGAVEVEKVDNANKPVTGINFNIYKQTDYDATNKAIKDKAVAIGSVSTVNGVAHADISTLSDGVIPAGAWKPESGTTKIFYIQEANPEGFTWNKTIIKAEVIGSETDPNGTKVTYTYILPTGEETTTKPVIKNTKITDVPGQKKFADNSNTLVKELYLTLYDATTNTVVTKNVYGENITSTVEVMKLADYKTTWKDLPYYDANGNVIKYSVKETKVVLTNGTVLDTEAKINGYFSREGTLTSDGVHLITNTAKEVFGKYAIQKIDADGNHDIYSKFFIYSDEKCEKQVGELSTNPSTGYAESNIISWLRAESMTKTFYAKEVENDGKHTLYPYTIKIVVAGEENVSNCKVTYSTLPLTGAALENAIANGYTGDITVDGSYIAIVPNNSITLTVSKKDITGKNELAGATLTIYKATKDGNGKYTKGDVLKIDGKDATWVSTNTNKVFDMFPAGHYVLVETIAPNGFALAEEVGFTVDQNKVVNQVTMLDDYTNVYIYKVDTEGKDVNGAELTLYDASNTALVKWSTGSNGAVISVNNTFTAEMVTYNGHKAVHIQRLVGGTTYRVVETKVPDGYVKAADVTIVPNKTTVAYEATMIDKPIEMEFSKVDRNGTEIEGATLTLYKATVGSNGKFVKGEKYISWVSGVDGRNADGSIKTHILKNIPAGNYILEETSAPTDHGFVKAESVEVVVKAIEGLQTAPKMVDDHTELHITKTDLVTGSEIVGATLQLIDKNGKVVVEWTTGNTNTTATKVNSQTGMTAYQKYDATSKKTELIVERIPVGTYTLREISAPNGYWVAEDVTIVIKEVGHLVEIQKAEMKDAPTETFFEKVDLVDGKPIKGATLTIYKSDKNKTKGAVVDSWVSDGTPHKILRLTDGYYLFEETNVPNGYKQAETIHFNYVQQSVAQRFVMKDDRYYGKVEVYKTDVDNKKLGNVSFGIYDKNGKLLETITTDADGYAITKNEYPVDEKDSNGNLHWLTYTIKEISAPAGYVITFKDMSFTFEGSTVVSGTYVARANAVNDYTRLYVNKYVAGTKNHLSGSVLAIYKVEDGKAVGDALYTWTTNGSSYYIDKIPAGNYVLREMEAPKGYFLAEDVFFTVKDTNANQTVDMEDRLLSKLPTTGKADGLMVMLFSLITSLSGCVVLFKRRRYAK